MNKLIIACLIFVFSTQSAVAKSTNTSDYEPSNSGIITPDVATGVRVFDYFNNDTAGNMVVCTDRGISGSCNQWTPLKDLVPSGKTYVGFRIVARYTIQLFWK